ncbi:MAG TPA: MBL fold metallo-hydrolase [Anaerolineae bacterium]|nr:MBL fold metallo-hydrolase [Anaerolineae bacterium]
MGAIEPRAGLTTVNIYLVIGRESAALIDSGLGIGDLCAEIGRITSLPCTVLNTHYHWDHIGANAFFDEIAIHECEVGLLAQEPDLSFIRQVMHSPAARAVLPSSFDPTIYRILPKAPTRVLYDNDLIDLGGRVLRVLHIPGHSPGHVAYLDESNGVLFTGDTAYPGPVYACFEGCDPIAFANSVNRLAALPNVRMICPGHNNIIADQGWLSKLAECVEAAIAGRVLGQPRDGFIVGQEYCFGSFSVWLPR